jgi:hypothetical protein
VVVRALVAHPRLRTLAVECGREHFPLRSSGTPPPLAAALGALLRANEPALRELRLESDIFKLDGVALRPILKALPANTHLHTLRVPCTAFLFPPAFARDVLLPAVRANASLRCLDTQSADVRSRADEHAQAMLSSARSQPRLGASDEAGACAPCCCCCCWWPNETYCDNYVYKRSAELLHRWLRRAEALVAGRGCL